MNPDPPAQENPPRRAVPGDSPFGLRVVKARHDLHSSIGHIVGFSEMWLEELPEQGCEPLQQGLEIICRRAGEMMIQINEGLNAPKIEAGLTDLSLLQRQVCAQASRCAS